MRKIISFLLCTCCCSSLLSFSGCYFESEIFGSAASSLKNESASLVSLNSGASSSYLSQEEESEISETESSQISKNEETTSASSQSSSAETSAPQNHSSEEEKEQESLPAIPNHINAALTQLGLKERADALALLLPSPLTAHFSAVSELETLSPSETPVSPLLFLPIYNNTTIEIYGLNFDDKEQVEQTLIYQKTNSPSGYGLAISLDALESFSDFRVTLSCGDISANYIIINDRIIHDNGEYFLNDSTFADVDYLTDTLSMPTPKDSLVSVVEYITDGFASRYDWKYLSDKTLLLTVAEGDDLLAGEYFIEASELSDGKGCCYYAVTLSQRTYDNGSAVGETIINRYLVTIPGNKIIPMIDENGNINPEYNDIII